MRILSALFLLALLSAPAGAGRPRRQYSPGSPRPAEDALGIARHGRDYLPESLPGETEEVLRSSTARFLENPRVSPAVQFGCVPSGGGPEEYRLERIVAGDEDDGRRLVALAVLIRAHAPSSVDLQWRTLAELRIKHPEWKPVFEQLRTPFTPRALARELSGTPPEEKYGIAPKLEWACRAAGILRVRECLPRLVQLSGGDHLHVSLAAQRSLEDFPGETGDRALAGCLRHWRYDAFVRAAGALRKRDRELLHETLLTMRKPQDSPYYYGLFLAWCDDAAAVPVLVEEVGSVSIIDDDLFEEIARLATREQMKLVESLPDRVRPEQRVAAERTVSAVRRRLGVEERDPPRTR